MATGSADLLQQGIAAAKSGQKETARRLLTQAVEQDEGNVTAWLWLSGVVESLDDKQVCMENVLALDPNNQAARKGLDWVLEQKEASVYTPPLVSESLARGTSKPLTPAAAILYGSPKKVELPPKSEPPAAAVGPQQDPSEALSQSTLEAMREFDNEYLCPYCAQLTRPDDKRCPACHGKLWTSRRKKAEPSAWFWVLVAYLIYYTLQSACGFLGLFWLTRNAPPEVASLISLRAPMTIVLVIGAIGVAIQVAELVLVLLRWPPIFWIMIASAVLGAVGVLAMVFLSLSAVKSPSAVPGAVVVGVIGMALALLPILFLLRIEDDFMVVYERVLCGPDPGIHSHTEFYMRGREYARKRMWALAAVHYKRAIGGAPTLLTYYIALAAAYIGLKRYERAEVAWREAQKREPNDPRVHELSNLIAAEKAKANTLPA